MIRRMPPIRQVLGLGLAWAVLWLILGFLFTAVIGVADPDSIDPGDTEGMIKVFSLMGFLSGVAFALATALAVPAITLTDLSVFQTAAWGVLSTAIVQIGFLGHGDSGLFANIMEALLFCVFGALIAMSWLAIARRWWRHA
jgi:hypothetical protein